MFGAIIGDVVGSRWEFNPVKTKDFEFLSGKNFFTDDTVMTLAIAKSLTECKEDYSDLQEITIKNMRELGNKYPDKGYGEMFKRWLISKEPKPYNSCGNGSAMRVGPCGEVAKSVEEAKVLARMVTEITHNHPEGLKGAEATAVAVYLAKQGKSLAEIKTYINDNYYPMNFTIDGIRDSYCFDGTCQGTVPQALMCVFEANSFENAIRKAVSLGGDADTLAAITGSVAEHVFDIDAELANLVSLYLPKEFLDICSKYMKKSNPPVFNYSKERLEYIKTIESELRPSGIHISSYDLDRSGNTIIETFGSDWNWLKGLKYSSDITISRMLFLQNMYPYSVFVFNPYMNGCPFPTYEELLDFLKSKELLNWQVNGSREFAIRVLKVAGNLYDVNPNTGRLSIKRF